MNANVPGILRPLALGYSERPAISCVSSEPLICQPGESSRMVMREPLWNFLISTSVIFRILKP